jgi:hypothetical protein
MDGDLTQTREALTQAPERSEPRPARSRRPTTAAPTHPIHGLQQTAGNRFVQSRLGIENGELRAGSALQSAVLSTNGRSPLPTSSPAQETGNERLGAEPNGFRPPGMAEETATAPETPPSSPGGFEAALQTAQESAEEAARSDEPEYSQSLEMESPERGAEILEQPGGGPAPEEAAPPMPEEAVTEAVQLPEEAAAGEGVPEATVALEGKGAETGAEAGEAAGEGVPGEGEGAAATEAVSGVAAEQATAGNATNEAISRLRTSQANAMFLGASRVQFAPRQDEQSGDSRVARGGRQRRAAVEALASEFLARNAGLIENILAYGDVVPQRLLLVAETAKAAIQAAVEENKATVQAQIAAQRTRAQAEAETARSQVATQYQQAVDAISQTIADARDQVETAYVDADITLDILGQDQASRIENLYAEYDPILRATGTTVGDEAVAVGQRRRDEYLARRNGESTLLDGPLHDNRMEASAEAAMRVANDYRSSLIEEGNNQAARIQENKPQDLSNIESSIEQSREILRNQLDQALTALDQAETDALATADQTQEDLLQAIDNNLQTTLNSLSQLEPIHLARLNAFGERQILAIETDADTAATLLLDGITQASTTLQDALYDFVTSARATAAPEDQALTPILVEAQQQADAMAAGLMAQIEEGISRSEQGIVDGGTQSVDAINEIGQAALEEASATVDSFASALSDLIASANETFSQLQASIQENAEGMVANAEDGAQQVIQQVESSFEETVALETRFPELVQQLEGGLRGGLDRLEADITRYANEAADQVQPRWKKVLKVLLVVVVVVVVAAITIVTAGAGLGLLGTIALGTVLGAASGAVIQIGNNLIDGKDAFEGVLQAAVVGAIGGAFGAFGAAAGAAVANVGLRIGLELGIDAIGSIVGDLVVGNPITAEGILLGAAIGLGAAGAPAALSGLRNLGGRIRTGIRGRITGARPRPRPTPAPSTRPSAEVPSPAGGRPTAPETPAAPTRRPTTEPSAPPRGRPEGETPPRTPEEAGRRVARETMEESGEAAARRAGRRPEAGEGETPRRPRDTEEGAGERAARREAGEEAAEEAAAKAAERPVALAAARQIAETNDALNTPVPILLGLLSALKRRFRWIRRFEAHPKGNLGNYSIHMIASNEIVDEQYSDGMDDEFLESAFEDSPLPAADRNRIRQEIDVQRQRLRSSNQAEQAAAREQLDEIRNALDQYRAETTRRALEGGSIEQTAQADSPTIGPQHAPSRAGIGVEAHHPIFRMFVRAFDRAGIPIKRTPKGRIPPLGTRRHPLPRLPRDLHQVDIHEVWDQLHLLLSRHPGASRNIARLLQAGQITPSQILNRLEDFYQQHLRNDPALRNQFLNNIRDWRRRAGL